jgi:hypothetical protein
MSDGPRQKFFKLPDDASHFYPLTFGLVTSSIRRVLRTPGRAWTKKILLDGRGTCLLLDVALPKIVGLWLPSRVRKLNSYLRAPCLNAMKWMQPGSATWQERTVLPNRFHIEYNGFFEICNHYVVGRGGHCQIRHLSLVFEHSANVTSLFVQ